MGCSFVEVSGGGIDAGADAVLGSFIVLYAFLLAGAGAAGAAGAAAWNVYIDWRNRGLDLCSVCRERVCIGKSS